MSSIGSEFVPAVDPPKSGSCIGRVLQSVWSGGRGAGTGRVGAGAVQRPRSENLLVLRGWRRQLLDPLGGRVVAGVQGRRAAVALRADRRGRLRLRRGPGLVSL